MKKAILTFAALVLIAAPALADMETDLGLAIDVSGDAVPADSYAKRITITTRVPFDLIAVTPDPGLDDHPKGLNSVRLSDPYLKDFNPSYARDPWTPLLTGTPTLAAAQGTPFSFGSSSNTRYIESFTIELLPSSPPYTRPHDEDAFIVAVWGAAQNPVGEWEYEYQRIFFCLGVWQVENLGRCPGPEWNITRDQILRVPAPAAIGLGMLGLGLIGWYMRRFA
ncbi:MAG: hypothetical protein NTU94_09540 [Planctomycetota bacterium]|nr:hypothetical protein [Planctomycetota bacterium]